MKIKLGEFDQNIDHALSMADTLCAEGKADEAVISLVGALIMEVREFRMEWRKRKEDEAPNEPTV